jgi:hypothetical protein
MRQHGRAGISASTVRMLCVRFATGHVVRGLEVAMSHGELRVDAEVVGDAGQALLTAANEIPSAPVPFVPDGKDPVSAAIAAQVQKMVVPGVDARPKVKREATRYAQSVLDTSRAYAATGQETATAINDATTPGASGGGGSGVAGDGVASARPWSRPASPSWVQPALDTYEPPRRPGLGGH